MNTYQRFSVNVENAQMNVNFSKMNLSPENVCVCAQVNNSLRILARPYDMPSTSLVFGKYTIFHVSICEFRSVKIRRKACI